LLLYCPYDRRVTRHVRRGADLVLVCDDCGRRVDPGAAEEQLANDLHLQRTAAITPMPSRPRARRLRPARARVSWLPFALVMAIVAAGIAVAINLAGQALGPRSSPGVVTAAVPQSQPAEPATAAAPASAGVVRVTNTDGVGAFLRRTPNLADRVRAWPDNTPLKIVGPDTTAEGIEWKQVEDPAGNRGWIPAQYTRPETNS
jgi:hypothetical protein